MDDIHKALLADVAGPDERNALSAWSTVVNMAGQVGILILGFVLWSQDVPDSAFVLTGALVAVGVVVTVAGVREPAPAVWAADRLADGDDDSRPPLREFLARYRGAAMLCLVIFAYWSGVNAVMPLVSVYTRDILGATVGEAQLLPALLLFTTTAMALPWPGSPIATGSGASWPSGLSSWAARRWPHS
jgi:Na+/melibiose symporter-like transporter